MNFETITLIVLTIIIIIREVSHYLQVSKLQELLKSNDISDYYSARKNGTASIKNKNDIMNEANDIVKNEQDFDIRKASKVIVNGEEMPITII